MSRERIARTIDNLTKYKVTGIRSGLAHALRDVDGNLVDFNSPFGYTRVGKAIDVASAYNQGVMALNAKKKFFIDNPTDIKVYGYVTREYVYLMEYKLTSSLILIKVAKNGRLVHSERREYIDLVEYAKEFEHRG